jgi:hypothetical protein
VNGIPAQTRGNKWGAVILRQSYWASIVSL